MTSIRIAAVKSNARAAAQIGAIIRGGVVRRGDAALTPRHA
jgi:hypothetical protein